jgi:hypothetical protein
VALHRLTLEGQKHARGATCRLAFDAADFLNALTSGEFAADLQIGRGVFGRRDQGHGGQHGVASQGGGESVLRLGLQSPCRANQHPGRSNGAQTVRQWEFHGDLSRSEGFLKLINPREAGMNFP